MKVVKLKSVENYPHKNMAGRIGKAMLKEYGFYQANFNGMVIKYVIVK